MSGHDHNFLSRFIHKIALQYPAVAEMSFDIENALAIKRADFPGNHVFISGLARSGTTILLNYLYQTGEFSSLTYADMPFVLMPNTWRKISRRSAPASYRERAHRDGLMIGPDSPEAFEEVFWRMFCGDNYIQDDRLLTHRVSAGLSEKFKAYIGNVLSTGTKGRRYLSKNNNDILRIDYLRTTFPDAYIIVPFRDPLQQAISLLNQHVHFCEIHKSDQFSLNYMNWLGHFEFGLNQKPFFLGDDDGFDKMQSYPKTDINFWLLTWKNYYSYLFEHLGDNLILFNYDTFCADPQSTLNRLFSTIGVPDRGIAITPFKPVIKSIGGFDEVVLEECNTIYKRLLKDELLF